MRTVSGAYADQDRFTMQKDSKGVVVGEKDDELTRRDFRAPYIGAICREAGCAEFEFEHNKPQAEALSRDLIGKRDATRFIVTTAYPQEVHAFEMLKQHIVRVRLYI